MRGVCSRGDAGPVAGQVAAYRSGVSRMKLRRLLTLAMAGQVMVTAAALYASYALSGSAGFGAAQLVALLASGAVVVALASLCMRAIERSQARGAAAQTAGQARAIAESAQMAQAVIKAALDAFI